MIKILKSLQFSETIASIRIDPTDLRVDVPLDKRYEEYLRLEAETKNTKTCGPAKK